MSWLWNCSRAENCREENSSLIIFINRIREIHWRRTEDLSGAAADVAVFTTLIGGCIVRRKTVALPLGNGYWLELAVRLVGTRFHHLRLCTGIVHALVFWVARLQSAFFGAVIYFLQAAVVVAVRFAVEIIFTYVVWVWCLFCFLMYVESCALVVVY